MIDSRRGAAARSCRFPTCRSPPSRAAKRNGCSRSTRTWPASGGGWTRCLIGIQRTALDDKGRERIVDRRQHQSARRRQIWLGAVDARPADAADDHHGSRRRDLACRQPSAAACFAADSAASSVPGRARLAAATPRAPIRPDANAEFAALHARLHRLVAAPPVSWTSCRSISAARVPDANGFSRLPFGLWRRQGGGFSVLSFDPQLLANVTPQLRVVDSEIEAQIRLHVEDLSQSKIRPWIRSLVLSARPDGLGRQRAILGAAASSSFTCRSSKRKKRPKICSMPSCFARSAANISWSRT